MTAEPDLPPITCPSSLVASCAPLLGFQPSQCVVGFILGVPQRPGPVLVRLDLGTGEDAPRRATELAGSIAGTGGTAVDLVAWVDAADDAVRVGLPSHAFLEELADRVYELGIEVPVAISTNGRVWWSHDCPDDLCCGGPRPLDPSVLTAVAAEYVFAGYAPHANRDALVARLATDPAREAEVGRLVGPGRPPANIERWRDTQVRFLTGLLVPGVARGEWSSASGRLARQGHAPLEVRVAARALRGLRDIVVRDTVLLRLIRCKEGDPEQWRLTGDLLADLVRCAPALRVAPPATVLAIISWMRGEGTSATIALDRAEADNPYYRLADLAREVMCRGTDPRTWAAAMSGLTEGEIRAAGRRSIRAVDGD